MSLTRDKPQCGHGIRSPDVFSSPELQICGFGTDTLDMQVDLVEVSSIIPAQPFVIGDPAFSLRLRVRRWSKSTAT